MYTFKVLCFDEDFLPYESDGVSVKYDELNQAIDAMMVCAKNELEELNADADRFEKYRIIENTGAVSILKCSNALAPVLLTLYYIVKEEN